MSTASAKTNTKKSSKKEVVAETPAIVAPILAAAVEKSARKGKKAVASAAEVAVAAPVVVAAAPAAAAPAKAARSKKAPAVAPAVEAASASVADAVVASVATEEAASPCALAVKAAEERFDALDLALKTHIQTLQDTRKLLDSAKKATTKQLREAFKRRKAEKKRPEGTLTGFQLPVAISAAMCKFLGVAEGSQMGRTEVAQRIREYAALHGLAQGKEIRTDAALQALLNPPAGLVLTHFNMQKYLKDHFPPSKSSKKAKASSASA